MLDHAPNGGAGRPLAAAFGVDVRNAFTSDSAFQRPTPAFPNAGHFSFTRRGGLIADHPVLTGVDDVRTYTGSSLQAPTDAAILLRLPSTAVDRMWNAGTKQFDRIPAGGRAQGVALEYGRGRVVVLGEAGMLTTHPGNNTDLCGTRAIAQSDIGNRRFALNIVRWLARKEVDEREAVAFVNAGCAAQPVLTLTMERVPILSGSVNGNRITFSVKSPNGVRTVTFIGSVAGDELAFERRVEVPPGGAPGGTGIFGVSGPPTFVAVREK